jgi:hypothetical protein
MRRVGWFEEDAVAQFLLFIIYPVQCLLVFSGAELNLFKSPPPAGGHQEEWVKGNGPYLEGDFNQIV